jgi:phosphoribosylformimino-5-aminoimidazole carboxamide ribotide isomerase
MITIIPAIDIIDGKCVRLSQGDYTQKKIYHEDPLEIAKKFEDHGIRRLHLVDLDGAKSKHVINIPVLEKIAAHTNLTVDYGGGIKTDDDIARVFDHGASLVTIGSIAIKDPGLFEKWIRHYGPDKIILGADVKDNKIAISGWLDVTNVDISDFLEQYLKMGIQKVLCTDISKDGMLKGAALGLYKELNENFPDMHLIASGGITTMEEIESLNNERIYGVIIGKALYEGNITLTELKEFILNS